MQLEDRNKLASFVRQGNVMEAMPLLKQQWSHERGERVFAEIGNDEQEYTYMSVRRNKDITITKRGWKDILMTTGIGRKEVDGMEALVVMLQGGYNSVGSPENMEFVVAVYKGGERVGDALVLKDQFEEYKPAGSPKTLRRLVRSSFDDLENLLANIVVKEETTKTVSIGKKRGRPKKAS